MTVLFLVGMILGLIPPMLVGSLAFRELLQGRPIPRMRPGPGEPHRVAVSSMSKGKTSDSEAAERGGSLSEIPQQGRWLNGMVEGVVHKASLARALLLSLAGLFGLLLLVAAIQVVVAVGYVTTVGRLSGMLALVLAAVTPVQVLIAVGRWALNRSARRRLLS